MGIEFPARTEEQRKSVGDFIECLTSQPGTTPQLEISPRALVANDIDIATSGTGGGGENLIAGEDTIGNDTVSEDPLLELLRTGHTLDEDAFLERLQHQRTPENVSP
jgi:hypothetical protein